MLQHVLNGTHLQTPQLLRIARGVTSIANRRAIFWILLAIGLVRSGLLIAAYPPAHASDSTVFYLYAQRLGGLDLPRLGDISYPLYSLLILLTTSPGSRYGLIAIQFLMSALVAPLYYYAIKPFSSILALVIAVAILSEIQVAILFNFVSTEPVYIFMMSLSFALLCRAAASKSRRKSALAGASLVWLLLTRTISRFLVLPFALALWLHTRDWRHPVALLAGFASMLALYAALSLVFLGAVEGLNTQDFYFYWAIVEQHHRQVSAENGPSSQQYFDTIKDCPGQSAAMTAYCLEQATGSWSQGVSVLRGVALESFMAHPAEILENLLHEVSHFLVISGRLFAFPDAPTPGEVQCAATPGRYLNYDIPSLRASNWGVALVNLPDQERREVLQGVDDFMRGFCPPLPNSPAAKALVDTLAAYSLTDIPSHIFFENQRYQREYKEEILLLYSLPLVITLMVPWARKRMLVLALAATSTLALHAFATALVVNVQARYVIVTYPLRLILFFVLGFIVLRLVVYALDWMLSQRTQRGVNAEPSET